VHGEAAQIDGGKTDGAWIAAGYFYFNARVSRGGRFGGGSSREGKGLRGAGVSPAIFSGGLKVGG